MGALSCTVTSMASDDMVKPDAAVEALTQRVRGVPGQELPGDLGNEPIDGSYPPDGEDKIHALEDRTGKRRTDNKLIAHERRKRVIEMRLQGYSFDAIAQALGYASHSGAYSAYMRAMELSGVMEGANQLRTQNHDRLMAMLSQAWKYALGGWRNDNGDVMPPSQQWQSHVASLIQQINRNAGVDIINQQQGGVPTINVGINNVMGGQSATGEPIDTSEAIIVADYDEDRYIAALRQATRDGLQQTMEEAHGIEVKPPTGYIAPKHMAADEFSMGDQEIIDAEVVEPDTESDEPAPGDPRRAIKL